MINTSSVSGIDVDARVRSRDAMQAFGPCLSSRFAVRPGDSRASPLFGRTAARRPQHAKHRGSLPLADRPRALAALAVMTLTAGLTSGAAADSHSDYASRALAAVRSLGSQRDTLDRDLYTASRTRCHGDTTTPTTACLIDAATERCAGNADCAAAADVIITNLRSTSFFLDDVTRARLVRSSTDYHAAVAAELRHRYAALAAELALAGPAANDGAAIDQLCRTRDRAIHACAPNDATCIPSLPWSRCVAALVWYVGGTP